jgi:aspartate/glutamate racemase
MSELFAGIILPETRERLIEIVQAMKEPEGVDGLILGGTELSLILRDFFFHGWFLRSQSAVRVCIILNGTAESGQRHAPID